MSDLNNESNEEKWTGGHKYDFIKRYAFLLFWLVLAIAIFVITIIKGCKQVNVDCEIVVFI